MKNPRLAAYAALGTVLLAACSGPVIQSFKDGTVATSRYRTYQWIGQDESKALRLSDPANPYPHDYIKIVRRPAEEIRAKRAIDLDLRKEGYFDSAEKPDFFVTFFTRARDGNWISTWEGSTPSGPGNVPFVMYPGFDPSLTDSYRKGALVVVFYDAGTKRPVWTGNILNALNGQAVDEAKITSDLTLLVSRFHRSIS